MLESEKEINSEKYAKNGEKVLNTLLDFVDQDSETLVSIRMRAEQEASLHQRRIEKVTANLGRPRFLYFILTFVLVWIAVNVAFVLERGGTFDPPPFYWLEGLVSLSALLMTTVVLITQNRQGKIDDQRRHLDLSITLLTERKVSKLIELVEELRRDLPMVKDRHDPHAEVMKEVADPDEVLNAYNRVLGETALDMNEHI